MDERGETRPAEGSQDPAESFRAWALGLFELLFVFTLIGGAVFAGSSDVRPLAGLVASIGVGLGLAAAGAMVLALLARRPWAIEASAWACVVLIAGGVLRSTIDLTAGRVTIPVEAVVGALVLSRRPPPDRRPPPLDAPGRRAAALVVAALLLTTVSPILVAQVRDGRILGATPDAIELVVDVDCGALPSHPRAPITINVRWHWLASEPLPGPTDGLVVRWIGETSQAAFPALDFVFDQPVTHPEEGVWVGAGSPAASLIVPIAGEGPAMAFGIDTGAVGLRDGSVALTLRPSPAVPPAHSGITVWAAYAHLDWWSKRSNDVTCTW